ncbi:MAG: T9SS type A sorting domain-containing protein [Bacteroidota bacterium]
MMKNYILIAALLTSITASGQFFRSCPDDKSNMIEPVFAAQRTGEIGRQTDGTDEISVFPNPANEKITVSFYYAISSIITCEIINMIGKTVYSTPISTTTGYNTSEIALTDLKSGIYFVKIKDGGNSVVKKFIIKK